MGVERSARTRRRRDGDVVRIGEIELNVTKRPYERKNMSRLLAGREDRELVDHLTSGELDDAALVKLAEDLARARIDGNQIVLVMSADRGGHARAGIDHASA